MEVVGLIVFFVVLGGCIVTSFVLMGREYEISRGKDGNFYLKNVFRDFAIADIMNSRVLVYKRGKIVSVSANHIKCFWFFDFVNRELGLKGYF